MWTAAPEVFAYYGLSYSADSLCSNAYVSLMLVSGSDIVACLFASRATQIGRSGGQNMIGAWIQVFSGWWFGTWLLFFHILGIVIPIDFHIFQGVETTNQFFILIHRQGWHLYKWQTVFHGFSALQTCVCAGCILLHWSPHWSHDMIGFGGCLRSIQFNGRIIFSCDAGGSMITPTTIVVWSSMVIHDMQVQVPE